MTPEAFLWLAAIPIPFSVARPGRSARERRMQVSSDAKFGGVGAEIFEIVLCFI